MEKKVTLELSMNELRLVAGSLLVVGEIVIGRGADPNLLSDMGDLGEVVLKTLSPKIEKACRDFGLDVDFNPRWN